MPSTTEYYFELPLALRDYLKDFDAGALHYSPFSVYSVEREIDGKSTFDWFLKRLNSEVTKDVVDCNLFSVCNLVFAPLFFLYATKDTLKEDDEQLKKLANHKNFEQMCVEYFSNYLRAALTYKFSLEKYNFYKLSQGAYESTFEWERMVSDSRMWIISLLSATNDYFYLHLAEMFPEEREKLSLPADDWVQTVYSARDKVVNNPLNESLRLKLADEGLKIWSGLCPS